MENYFHEICCWMDPYSICCLWRHLPFLQGMVDSALKPEVVLDFMGGQTLLSTIHLMMSEGHLTHGLETR